MEKVMTPSQILAMAKAEFQAGNMTAEEFEYVCNVHIIRLFDLEQQLVESRRELRQAKSEFAGLLAIADQAYAAIRDAR